MSNPISVGEQRLTIGAGGTLAVEPTAEVLGLLRSPGITNSRQSVAMVSGRHTMLAAVDTIVTGLATVTAIVASLDSDPTLTCDRASASIGDQAGTPAAGSAFVKAWMPTSNANPTPIAATGFAGMKVSWIAFGQ